MMRVILASSLALRRMVAAWSLVSSAKGKALVAVGSHENGGGISVYHRLLCVPVGFKVEMVFDLQDHV